MRTLGPLVVWARVGDVLRSLRLEGVSSNELMVWVEPDMIGVRAPEAPGVPT